jgi:hypothetical protein
MLSSTFIDEVGYLNATQDTPEPASRQERLSRGFSSVVA